MVNLYCYPHLLTNFWQVRLYDSHSFWTDATIFITIFFSIEMGRRSRFNAIRIWKLYNCLFVYFWSFNIPTSCAQTFIQINQKPRKLNVLKYIVPQYIFLNNRRTKHSLLLRYFKKFYILSSFTCQNKQFCQQRDIKWLWRNIFTTKYSLFCQITFTKLHQ